MTLPISSSRDTGNGDRVSWIIATGDGFQAVNVRPGGRCPYCVRAGDVVRGRRAEAGGRDVANTLRGLRQRSQARRGVPERRVPRKAGGIGRPLAGAGGPRDCRVWSPAWAARPKQPMLKLPHWALSTLTRIVFGLVVYMTASWLLTFTTFTALARGVISAVVSVLCVAFLG
jgi:hypothetical protein